MASVSSSSAVGPSPGAAERGFVILAVLWILGALATLASVYSVYVANSAAASHVTDDRLQAEASITACLELAAYQMTAAPEAARPSHGSFAARIGRSRAVAQYQSEGARIDLNAAPKELLAGLFAAIGASDAQAAFYADRIVGWRTKRPEVGQNDEVSAYRMAGLTYEPRQGPFANVLELSLVRGLPAHIVERILPFVTVFNGQPQIDIVNAAPEVVASLPGMTPERLHDVLAERARQPQDAQALLKLLGSAAGNATIDGRKASRVSVRVDLDDGRRVLAEVVILLIEDGDQPYGVLYWRDDFDGPA